MVLREKTIKLGKRRRKANNVYVFSSIMHAAENIYWTFAASKNKKKTMKKGDCIILEDKGLKFGLILHHSSTENEKTKFGFIIIGEAFENTPSKSEIESSGILGYKYQNDTADLLNSMMRFRQKHDKSTFYTGVKYDMITIPESLFGKEQYRIKIVANVNLNPDFYPIPKFYSRESDYDKICKVITERISKKDPKTIEWSTIYDAYPLKEILEEENEIRRNNG